MSDQHRVAHEVEPLRRDVGKDGRSLHHLVRDTGQRRDKARNRDLRIDEREKLIDYASIANAVSAELDETIGRRLRAGRFDVHDDKLEVLHKAQLAIVPEQFDGMVLDFETAIVSD